VFAPTFIENTGMEDVTHKQIYDRLVEVEKKVEHIDVNTVKIRDAFESVQGALRCSAGSLVRRNRSYGSLRVRLLYMRSLRTSSGNDKWTQ